MNKSLQKISALYHFARLARDPNRLNEVFEMSDAMADQTVLERMVAAVRASALGAEALRERARLRIDMAELAQLPEGTLGRAFYEHMHSRGLDPSALPVKPADDELSFVRAHIFDTHDVWHVATGFDTDVAGELGLQAFYLAQLPGRVSLGILAGGMLNTLFWSYDDREARLNEISRGWQLGKRAQPLFGVRWDKLWTTPLAEVRAQLGLATN